MYHLAALPSLSGFLLVPHALMPVLQVSCRFLGSFSNLMLWCHPSRFHAALPCFTSYSSVSCGPSRYFVHPPAFCSFRVDPSCFKWLVQVYCRSPQFRNPLPLAMNIHSCEHGGLSGITSFYCIVIRWNHIHCVRKRTCIFHFDYYHNNDPNILQITHLLVYRARSIYNRRVDENRGLKGRKHTLHSAIETCQERKPNRGRYLHYPSIE